MSHQKDTLEEIADPVLAELRARVHRPGNFHVPQPGDPDYQTPEQIAEIKRRLEEHRFAAGDDL